MWGCVINVNRLIQPVYCIRISGDMHRQFVDNTKAIPVVFAYTSDIKKYGRDYHTLSNVTVEEYDKKEFKDDEVILMVDPIKITTKEGSYDIISLI